MKRFVSAVVSLALVCFFLLPMGNASAEELIVSAAASLTDAFSDIEPAFEAANPGVDVVMNFASSGALYRQIEQGAPADVYASANPKWMAKAVDSGFVTKDAVTVFAHNSLVLATPANNPSKVSGLKDLTGDKVKSIGIGTPKTVPAGKYAEKALTAAGLFETLKPKYIYAESVRQVLDYLARGEVDCGFVYGTDATKGGDAVLTIEEIPLKKPVTYPIAALKDAKQKKLAQAFVDFVVSAKGQELLQKRGFKKP